MRIHYTYRDFLGLWAVIAIFLGSLWLSPAAVAQTYSLPANGLNSITTCSGNLYDSGGPNGNYTTYSDGATTIYPALAGNKVKLEFSQGSTYYYDQLIIYDGESTSAPIIGSYTNTYSPSPGTVYATNSSGALTVRFVSSYYSYPGFSAAISCVTSVPKPDLAIQGASAQPLSVVAGGNVTVSSAIYNLTGSTASSSNVGYYLSTDGVFDSKDLLIGNSTGASLAPGSSSTRRGTVQIPTTTSTGTYYVLFVADYQNTVAESNEDNNVASVAVSVVPATVDLSMLQANVSSTNTASGNAISFSGYVQNTGNAAASSSSVGYYLSSNATFDNADVLLTSSYGGVLAAGTSSYVSATTNIPGSVKAGSYYILFVADYQTLVTETNENNNVTAVAITVSDPTIDLIVTQASISTSATAAGSSISSSAYVYNQGNTTAASSSLGYYLSKDNKIDGNDILLSSSIGGALGSGRSGYRSATLSIPSTTAAGNYFVLLAADYDNLVTESNETNNLATFSLQITEPSIDLAARYTSLSTGQVFGGGNVTVYSYIYNLGNSSSGASSSGIYLSKDNVLDASDALLSTTTHSAIPAGSYSSRSSTIQIPATTAAGTYYVLVAADYDKQIKESDELNNADAVALTVVAPAIDLYIYTLAVDNPSVITGGSITGSFRIANGGNSTSASSNAQVFLSKDEVYDSQDVLLQTSAGGTLMGGYYSSRTLSGLIPSNTAVGNYYLLVIADPTDLVKESDEKNNLASYAIIVRKPFSGTIVPSTGTASITTCGTTIADDGGADNYKTYSNGSLTIYPATTGAKVQLEFTEFALSYYATLTIYDGPNSSYPVLLSYTRLNSSPGTIKATNSTGALTVTFSNSYVYTAAGFEANVSCVGGVSLPDLTLSAATLPSTSVMAGASLLSSVKIANSGTANAAASTIGYYLSTDDKFSTSDVALATVAGGALAANANATRTATLTIPAATAAGSYYVLMVADPAEAVTESDEANNLTALALTITSALPNLELTAGKLSVATVTRGGSLTSSVNIKNSGLAAAAASTISYYLSTNTTLDATDVSLGQTTGGALAAGSSATRAGSLTIAAATAAGSYYVLMVADAAAAVAETDETDNVEAVSLTVTDPLTVDLTLSTPTLSKTSSEAGTSLSASVTITNAGTGAAASSSVGFYLSSNQTLDATDVALATVAGGALAANANATRTATLTIPAATAAGSYYVLMVADPAKAVTESDEANNLTALALTITTPVPVALPDLTFVVASTTLSAKQVAAGATVQVNGTIFNAGTGSATGTPYTVFLSTDQTLGASDLKLGSTAGIALGSGQLGQQSLTVTVPTGTAAGNYYILVMLNADNTLNESNMANNLISLPLQVNVTTAQQEQTAGLTIGVYPNPASRGYFRVSLEGGRPTSNAATLTLFNSIGQRIDQRVLTNRNGVVVFDTQTLSKGVYLLRITGEGLSVLRRVVVE